MLTGTVPIRPTPLRQGHAISRAWAGFCPEELCNTPPSCDTSQRQRRLGLDKSGVIARHVMECASAGMVGVNWKS
jgi:hypothetical protein